MIPESKEQINRIIAYIILAGIFLFLAIRFGFQFFQLY